MKFQFVAKVVGHEILDGKKSGADQLRVKLAMRPVQDTQGKSGTAAFILPAAEGARLFPLRRTLLITCEECQYEMFAEMAGKGDGGAGHPGEDPSQTSFGLTRGDSPTAEPPVPRGSVTPIGASRRGAKRGQRGPEVQH